MKADTRPNAFVPPYAEGRLKRTLTPPSGSASSVFLPAELRHLRSTQEAHHTHPPSSKRILTAFQSAWHPFKLAATKANANRVCFEGVLSVSPQSVCSSRHSFSCLIYFILKGLSICITRTGWEKVSDVCGVGFLLLFVIVKKKNNGLPLSGHTPDSPTHPPQLPQSWLAFLCRYLHIRGMNCTY